MTQCPENLNDSDVTFYCPDTDKDPTEERFLDSLSENDEDYYERVYNKYAPVGLNGPRPTSLEPEPDSDQTFFELAENALGTGTGLLPETDETFFSPAESAARPLHQFPPAWGSPSGPSGPDEPKAEETKDVDALSFVVDFLQHGGQNLFTHDLQWGQLGQACKDESMDGGPGAAVEATAASSRDLYFELPDPLTQEMHVYRVPALQTDTDTMRLLTQDFNWTQNQVEGGSGHPDHRDIGHHDLRHPVDPVGPETSHTQTEDLLDWTQAHQAWEVLRRAVDLDCKDETAAAAATAALASDTTTLHTQDLDWTQTQGTMDMVEVPKHELAPLAPDPTASSGHSMDVGSAASPQVEGLGGGALQQRVDSSGSSENQRVPSVPSFDDDLGQPTTPSGPLVPEEQFKMEQIVASLRSISFNLDNGVPRLVDPPHDSKASCPNTSPLPPSQPRSPTFTNSRRGRPRGRGQRKTTPSASAVTAHSLTQGAVAGGSKRKRSGLGLPLTRSGSFGPGPGSQSRQRSSQPDFSSSPTSPPRRKTRRTVGPATSASSHKSRVGRVEMIAAYSRLRELRFFMQDIIAGREPLPTAEEVERMRQEVLAIIGNIDEAEPTNSKHSIKAILKRQEARQVADKLLHQLRVIAECHESQGNQEVMFDGTSQSTSWANTTVEVPLQSILTASNAESNFTAPENKLYANSATIQKMDQEKKPKKSSKEQKQRRGKWKNDSKKTAGYFKQEKLESNWEKKNDPKANVWHSCMNPPSKGQTDIDEQFGAIIVEETEEAQEKTVTDTYIEILQTEIFSDAIHSNDVCSEENKVHDSFPSMTDNPRDSTSSIPEGNLQKEEQDPTKQEEYQYIVGLIKSKAETTLRMKSLGSTNMAHEDDFTCETDPMTLTGILLPKRSELEPMLDFPEDLWGNPQAPIPEEWITMLEWDD